MRFALITGIPAADPSSLEVVCTPGSPQEINEAYKRLVARNGGGLLEIQMWVSDSGITKRKRFSADEAQASVTSEDAIIETGTPVEDITIESLLQSHPDVVSAAVEKFDAMKTDQLKAEAAARGIEAPNKQIMLDALVLHEAKAILASPPA
jgi:hypothetical protein